MDFHAKSLPTIFALFLCAGLMACAGVSPGGAGGPPSGGGSVPVLGGQNSLDGGGLPGGDTAQGQAVPSTQQSEPGVGAPCVIRFVATVRVTRGALEQSCRDEEMEFSRRRAIIDAVHGETTGTMAPPENPGPGPEVAFTFRAAGDIEDRVVRAQTHCAENGQWQTKLGDLSFFTIPKGLDCPEFSAKAQASWNQGGILLTGPVFSGSPAPQYDESLNAYRITLGIDLGPGRFEAEGVHMLVAP